MAVLPGTRMLTRVLCVSLSCAYCFSTAFDMGALGALLDEKLDTKLQPIKETIAQEQHERKEDSKQLKESQRQILLEQQRIQQNEQTLAGVQAELFSIRRTTEELASAVLAAPCTPAHQRHILDQLAEVEEAALLAAWQACQPQRTAMRTVTKEDSKGVDSADVQSLVTAVAQRCCGGGPLRERDTHASGYPSNHMLDGSFVASTSPCADPRYRVTWAELCAFFELKFDLEQEGMQRSVAVQCHDRVFEMMEASSRRRFAVFFMADKAKIRLFRFDRRPLDGTAGYVSTPWLPFLSDTGGVTEGFRFFFRLCRSQPDQLGLPALPDCPALPGQSLQLFLLRDGAGVKADVYRAEHSADGSKLVCKHFQDRAKFDAERSALLSLAQTEAAACVPRVIDALPAQRLLLLQPFGVTLREAEFDTALLIKAAAACARALRAAHTLAPPLCHYDPSPGELLPQCTAKRVDGHSCECV